jgi:hypothetical protein
MSQQVSELPDDPNAVSLNPDTSEDNAVNLPVLGENTQPLPPPIAKQRAGKTISGGLTNKDPTDLYADFLAGKEQDIRVKAASDIEYQKQIAKQKAIQDIAVQKGGPLTPEEVAYVLDPFNKNNQTTDVSSVIERAYATNYVSSLNTAKGFMTDNIVDTANQDIPKQVEDTMQDGSELLTKNQYILTRMQNTQQNIVEKQSWPGYLLDEGLNFLEPYAEYRQRGLIGSALSGLGLGSNLDEAHYTLYRQPFPVFKETFDKAMDTLEAHNPSLAVSYAQSLLAQDTFQSNLNNMFTALQIPDAYAATKGISAVVKKVNTLNQIRKATADLVSSAARDPNAGATRAAEGAGDVRSAVVEKMANNIEAALNGNADPLKAARDAFLSTWKEDGEKFRDNQGTFLSRELLTRIQDGFAQDGESLLNLILTMNRVERTPVAVTSRDVIAAYIDKIRGDYKGPAASLLDVQGPIREPISGTYWYKQMLGHYDGTQFADAETAEGFAKQLGITNPIIKGTEGDKIYFPSAALLKTERTDVFKTSKGSTYQVHSDGTTTRNKAARPEHPGDQGPQQKSNKTVYITEDQFKNLKRRSIEGLKVKSEPKVGLVPVETWNEGPLKGKIHFGNTITELGAGEDTVARRPVTLEHHESGRVRLLNEDGIEVAGSSKPEPGFIPYNKKTKAFEEPLTAERASVEQQGLGFHIEVWTPMKENDDLIRDTMIRTVGTKDLIKDAISNVTSASGTKNIINSVLGWVRNSDETLSVNETAQRKAVTYTQANIQIWAKQLYKDIEDVAAGRIREDQVTGEPINPLIVHPKTWIGKISSRKVAQQFERTLDYAREAPNPDAKPGDPPNGYFFKTAGELQDFYQRNFKRDPSYLETKAYFNYTKLVEGDRMLGEIAEFRNRARIGTEQHQIISLDKKTGDQVKSGFFDGIRLPEFPRGEGDILITSQHHGSETIYELGAINTKKRLQLEENVRTGKGKVIQIYNRDHQPLSDYSDVTKDKLISHVYTENAEAKPLEFNHVERRGGGHFEWNYDHFLKQADVRKQTVGGADKRPGLKYVYVGDTTAMPVKSRAEGEGIAKIWNEAHQHINAGRWDDVKPLAQKLGIPYDVFTGWYHGDKPRFNSFEPMVVVSRNKKISEMSADLANRYRFKRKDGTYRDLFKDATKSGPANNFKVAYNTERHSTYDMKLVTDVGTQGNPVYQYQPAEMLDPLTTMNRALNRAINSTFMDDYKLYSVEHWLREAEKYLDATPSEIRATPFSYFNNPKWRPGVDKTIIWNLLSNRFKSQQLVGMPNKFDTWIHSFTTQMADNFYAKFGPEGSRNIFQKSISIVPIWMLHHVTDPVGWMRSVTFNFKLGLLSPAQFLVQAQTHAVIWALEPRHGTVGTYHALLHGWSHFAGNDKILKSLDDYATKLNMLGSKARPGEWLEAREELNRSGFAHVAGEYSNLNNQLKTRFIQNDWEKGLKIGQFPFRMGEQSNRITAWYTAFREFRDANPTTPITNIERSKILNKADLLTVNMSRASSSGLNHGVFSLSTQFLTYQIKLAELFWSKRLGENLTQRTLARAGLLGMYMTLYGLPNAVGVTGAPIMDNLREHFMDDLGYIPGEKWTSTMLNEGLPAWAYAMATGTLPNVGDRFGSQGWQNIREAMRSNIPWWQAAGGASASVVGNFFTAALDPFYQGALSWARGDTADKRFTIRSADLVEPFKQISSVSAGAKWWSAIQTGKWISNNESYITDISPIQATILALTGMSPQEQDDMFTRNQMIQGETDAQKSALKDFIKDWRRGIQAKENGDDEQGNAYHRNAIARLTTVGMPYEKVLSAIAIANKGYEKAIDASNYNSWAKGDVNKQQQRLEYYKRQMQLQNRNK